MLGDIKINNYLCFYKHIFNCSSCQVYAIFLTTVHQEKDNRQ